MVVPDFDIVAGKLGVAGQRAQGVVIVVKDGDFHGSVLYIPGKQESTLYSIQTESGMSQASEKRAYDFSDRTKYDALMDVVRNRMTVRAFDPAYTVPREHFEMILDAA